MNYTSLRGVSFITSLIIAIVSAVFLLAFRSIGLVIVWWHLFLFAGLMLLVSFAAIHFLMDKFIYGRIKMLYKVINLPRNGAQKPNIQISQDAIYDIEEKVKEYAIGKKAEIEELKQMEQYRKEFLGDVSHELKTPIFNTQGYIETLLNGAIDDTSVNKSYLLKASKNLDRLNSIVEDLVTISKYETQATELKIEKFDIVELIKEVYEEQEMMADLKDVVLRFKKDSPQSKFVLADKKSIKTVMNNLVNNAIKYGDDESEVVVGLYDIHDNILVEISDKGPGIDKKYLPRLFDRFFRIDKHRSRFDGGNGLGLAICKHIMETHNQSINVRSTLGEGTTFGITLAKAK